MINRKIIDYKFIVAGDTETLSDRVNGLIYVNGYQPFGNPVPLPGGMMPSIGQAMVKYEKIKYMPNFGQTSVS